MARRTLLPLLAAASLACGGPPAPEPDAGPPAYVGTHAFPALELAIGEERLDTCQSWTLHNPTDLWVSGVEMTAGAGWHHSNWVFVPQTEFEGPDGTWRCRDRRFSEIAAGGAGGGAFFAQSTQSTGEDQVFPAGTAYRIPAWSRIIGSVHVVNTTGAPLSTAITFTIRDIPETEVATRLRPLVIDDRGVELAPRATSEVTTACDFTMANGGPLGFGVYYVLPHYHALADGMRVTVHGGPDDGRVIFETTGGIGNALGGPIDPPIDLTGALGVRIACTYTNPGADTITWGENATDEMCTMLAYTSSGVGLGGLATAITARTPLPSGTTRVESSCIAVGVP
jgi:hypothetical protein